MKRALVDKGDEDPKRPKAETVQCPFCHKTFKKRGLTRHQKHCHDKPDQPPTAPENYKFCLLNEEIFSHILSFLGNQTLVKLQSITGDYYARSRRELAKICCSCENDNVAMVAGWCAQCELEKNPGVDKCVHTSVAKDLYGIERYTKSIPRQGPANGYASYARVDLEKHVVKKHGSKMLWLYAVIAKDKKDGGRRKAVAKRIQAEFEYKALLCTLPPECAKIVGNEIWFSNYDVVALQQRAERYFTMAKALKDRGVAFRDDCSLYDSYIRLGDSVVDEIVDLMEEKGFLFDHTSYVSRCSAKASKLQRHYHMWGTYDSDASTGSSDTAYSSFFSTSDDDYFDKLLRCELKRRKELCIEHLQDSKGLTLPRKWEVCRRRYDSVVSAGASPKQYMEFIRGRRSTLRRVDINSIRKTSAP